MTIFARNLNLFLNLSLKYSSITQLVRTSSVTYTISFKSVNTTYRKSRSKQKKYIFIISINFFYDTKKMLRVHNQLIKAYI